MPFDPYSGEPVTPVVTYHCNACATSNPVTEQHRCPPMTARQARRFRAGLRLDRILADREARPVPCTICGGDMTPGRAHACRTRPLDKASAQAAAWQRAELVDMLKRAGFNQQD
jgi:hypothetical protein